MSLQHRLHPKTLLIVLIVLSVSVVISRADAIAAQLWLTWTDNSDNEEGFEIERRTTATPFVPIALIGANVTGHTDSGLAAGTTYCYRLRAFNADGFSKYSNAACDATRS